MVKIPALVFDMRVDSGKLLDCLPPTVARFLSAADLPLHPA
jgi:hypothetical protein